MTLEEKRWLPAHEMQRGAVTRLLAKAVKSMLLPVCWKHDWLAAGEEAMAAMAKRRQALRIRIVGEIYTVLEPFTNMRVERLGEMGVEVERALFLGDWSLGLFWTPSVCSRSDRKCGQRARL